MRRVPRAAGLVIWTLAVVGMFGLIPNELSRLRDRVEPTRKNRPGARGAGLVLVTVGASLMAWAFAAHYKAAPRGWAIQFRPTSNLPESRLESLIQTGPYRLTRNPMYAGEMIVWLGWAVFYNRPPVWAGMVIWCAAVPQLVRWEEQRLLERFGEDYRAYVASVPRWAGTADTKWRPLRGQSMDASGG